MRERVRRRGAVRGPAIAVAAALALIISGCGGDDDGSPSAQSSKSGEVLYAANCASCHGADLRGTLKGPSHLSVVYEPGHHPDESFRQAIQGGVRAHHWNFGDMAPISGLTSDEIDAIIAYVREVQEREGLEPYPPELNTFASTSSMATRGAPTASGIRA